MSETVNTAEIRVVADASGVEAGLRPAIDAAQRTERAISGIGTGSARSQQNLIQAIQRTTAEMEAGSRTGARYFEVIAQQRGIDPGVLQPYLQQLRAVEQAQQGAGQSAGQTANALRQVPAQLTDVITSLQGGMEPLTVLIQQGGQLRDSFGGIGPAARAMGSQVLAMVNPLTVAAAAVAILTAAYYEGSQEADLYRNSLVMTGNAIGLSVGQVADMAQAIGEVSGTQRGAVEALVAMVDAGNISADRLQRFASVAIDLQDALGISVADTAQEFSDLGGNPVEAVEKLNGKYHFLTSAVYDQIRALENQGRTEEAAEVAQDAFAKAMEARTKTIVANLGYIESRWKELGEFASKAWDKMLGIGRADSSQDKLNGLLKEQARIEENIASARANKDTYGERKQQILLAQAQSQISAIRGVADAEKEKAKAEAASIQAEEARIKWTSDGDKFLSKKVQLEREIAKARAEGAAAGASVAEIEERIAKLREKYKEKGSGDAAKKAAAERKEEAQLLAELSGVTASYMEDLSRLNGQYAKGNLSQERYVELVTALISKQPGAKKMIDETAKEMADYAKSIASAEDALEKELASITKQIQATKDQNEQIGLSKSAIAELEAERLLGMANRLEENAITAEGLDLTGAKAEGLRKEAAALRELAAAKRDGAARQVGADSAKQAADDWKKASETIEKSLTDALLRGFESGKGFGENLVDTLKNMFSTLVLRPTIQAALAPVSNSVSSMLPGMPSNSVSGSAGNLTQTVSSLYNSFKSGGSFERSVAEGVQTGLDKLGLSSGSGAPGQAAQWAGRAGGVVAGYMAGNAINAGISGGYETGSGFMTAQKVGTAVASFIGGPIGGAIAGAVGGLINRAFGRKDKEVTGTALNGTFGAAGFTGSTDTSWKQEGGWFRSDKRGVDKVSVDAATVQQFTAGYDALKFASADFASTLGIDAEWIKSRSQSMSIALGADGEANKKAIADFFVNVGDTIAREVLPTISQFAKEGEGASATLERVAVNYAMIETALSSLGKSFGPVGAGSIAARERLIELSGGLEAFARNTAAFEENYFTAGERNAQVLKRVTEQMAGLGLAGVDTRQEFRQIVLGLDLATDAGARQYAALMDLQGAFAQVTPEIQDVTKDLTSYRESLTDAYNAESEAIQGTVSRMGSFASSLRELNKSALLGDLSPLSPQEKYAEAKAQYETVLAAARSGDESAQSNYSAAFNSFLTASRAVFASSGQYQADFAYAQASTAEAERWAGAQVDVGKAQLDALKLSVSGLIDVKSEVMSFREAFLQMHQVMGTTAPPAPGVMAAPQINMPTPVMYASYGADNTVALVAELKSVRQELASLRAEQAVQTGHLIQANAKAASDSADQISGATTTAVKAVANSEQRVPFE